MPSSPRRVLVALVLASALPAIAQQIAPDFQDLSLSRGQRKRVELTIGNGQDLPLDCVVRIEDMAPSLEGFPRITPGYERGCADWTALSADSLRLMPRSVKTVMLDIDVPRDATGGYYALIEGRFRAGDRSLSEMSLSDREAGRRDFFPPTAFHSLLLIEVKTRENQVMVATDSLHISSGRDGREVVTTPGATATSGWAVDLVLRNDGNMHTRIAGTAAIWRTNGTLVGKAPFEVGRGYVLPATRRVFKARGDESLADGLYLGRFDMAVERQGRFQEVAAFHVSDGIAHPGEPDSAATALLQSLLPRFSFRKQFRETRVLPGRPASVIISLLNTHSDTLHLRPVPVTWRVDSLGVNQLRRPDETDDSGPCAWITELPPEFALPPRRNATCRLRVQLPDDTPEGEYYLGVLFEDAGGEPTPRDARLARSQLTCLSNGRNLPFNVTLDTLSVIPDGRSVAVDCRLTNLGQTRAACRPVMSISRRDVTGKWRRLEDEIGFPSGETMFLFPGGARVYEQRVDGMLPGEYSADLTVEFAGERQEPIHRTRYFEIGG